MKKLKTIIALTLVLVMVFVTSISTFAANTTAESTDATAISANVGLTKSTIDEIDQYIKIENNQYVLVLPKNVEKKMTESQLTAIKQSINTTNNLIKNSSVSIDSTTKTAIHTVPDQQILKSDVNTVNPMVTYGGVTKVVFYWWGFQLYLSSSMVRYIAIGGVGAISAILALIPGVGWSIAAAIVGAVGGAVAGDTTFPALIVTRNNLLMTFDISYQ